MSADRRAARGAPVAEQRIRTPESKVRPPIAQVAVVHRERVLSQIAAARFQILAVEAPGGFGKSTLAAQFAAQSVVSAWATLDETDSDPLVLLTSILSALNYAGVLPAGTPSDWSSRQSGDEPSFSRFVVPEFRRIIETSSPATIVLDHLDVLVGPQARTLLVALVDSLPSGSSVALVGRSLRLLPLARWRSQGRLLTVSAGDLLLDEPEIAQALRGFQGRTADPGYVQEVARRTEGWPVAVYLGAISDHYPALGAADLSDYFDAEILARVDPDVLDFLRRTAPLDVLSAPACSAVLDPTTDVTDLLTRVQEASLLVRGIQGETRSFHVHALLREHLLAQFAERDPQQLRRVHARASSWCTEQHLTDQAITHARLSGDDELLGAVLWPAVADALLLGQGGRARRWLDAVDPDVIGRSPALAIAAAWTALSFTEPQDAARWGEVTARLLGPDWAEHLDRSTVEPCFALLVALSGAEGWQTSARLGETAAAALKQHDFLRVFALEVHGLFAVLAGDQAEGVAVLERCRTLASSYSLFTTWTEAAALLAVVHAHAGDAQRAAGLVAEARATWERHDREGGLTTAAILGLASAAVALLTDDAEGRARVTAVVASLPTVGPILPWLGALIHATAARCAVDDEPQAVEHLRQARSVLASLPDSQFLTEFVDAAEREVARRQRIAVLSPAERRVWRLLHTRMTLREIADELFLSPETVKTHTAAIYRKLGVASRREAQELGETLPPDPDPRLSAGQFEAHPR